MHSGPSAGYVLSRVGARAAAGLWAHRGALVLGLVVLAALTGYALTSFSGGLETRSAAVAPASLDCADTAMAVVFDKSAAAVNRAYECMDPSFQQRVSESQFSQQMLSQRLPSGGQLARVGDHQNPSGGALVYYAVDGGGQSVGYIVYLGPAGKVLKIE